VVIRGQTVPGTGVVLGVVLEDWEYETKDDDDSDLDDDEEDD